MFDMCGAACLARRGLDTFRLRLAPRPSSASSLRRSCVGHVAPNPRLPVSAHPWLCCGYSLVCGLVHLVGGLEPVLSSISRKHDRSHHHAENTIGSIQLTTLNSESMAPRKPTDRSCARLGFSRFPLEFSKQQGNYIKTFPLHESQRIVDETEDTVLLEIYIHLTKDIIMELLKYGSNVEVLEPKSLIATMKERVKKMANMYE